MQLSQMKIKSDVSEEMSTQDTIYCLHGLRRTNLVTTMNLILLQTKLASKMDFLDLRFALLDIKIREKTTYNKRQELANVREPVNNMKKTLSIANIRQLNVKNNSVASLNYKPSRILTTALELQHPSFDKGRW